MRHTENNGWIEYESIQKPLYSHYGDREFFDERGNWISSAVDGYDFQCLETVGYIHYWTDKPGKEEYVLKVPLERFAILLFDFLHLHGRQAIEEYVDWEYKDGAIIATRIVN